MRPAKCLILSRSGTAEAHWGRDLEADPGIIERREPTEARLQPRLRGRATQPVCPKYHEFYLFEGLGKNSRFLFHAAPTPPVRVEVTAPLRPGPVFQRLRDQDRRTSHLPDSE